jgi:hypothetical protein
LQTPNVLLRWEEVKTSDPNSKRTPMLRWLIRRKLNAEEKRLGESVDYIRHVVDVSPTAFFRFASILPFANSRKTLPKDAWFVAQIVGSQDEIAAPACRSR